MGEFEGTKGTAEISRCHSGGIDSPLTEIGVTVWKYRKEDGGRSGYSVFSAEYRGRLTKIDIKKDEANAELVRDAFNVRQQIDCPLTELLEQRDEAIEALELIVEYCGDIENEYTQLKKTRPFIMANRVLTKINKT